MMSLAKPLGDFIVSFISFILTRLRRGSSFTVISERCSHLLQLISRSVITKHETLVVCNTFFQTKSRLMPSLLLRHVYEFVMFRGINFSSFASLSIGLTLVTEVNLRCLMRPVGSFLSGLGFAFLSHVSSFWLHLW